MANDKESSIYDGQSGAGSANELDEYGVWVKSDPAETSASEKGDVAFPIPDDESLSDFEINEGEIEKISADELDLPAAEDINDFEKEFIPEDLGSDLEDLDSMSFDNLLDPELDDIEELQVEDILRADPDFLTVENQKFTEVPTIDALSLGAEAEEAAESAFGQSAGRLAFDEAASSDEAPQPDVSGESEAVSEEVSAHVTDVAKKGTTELFIEDFLDDAPFDDDEIPMEEEDAETEVSADGSGEDAVVETEAVPVEREESVYDVSAAADELGEDAAVEAEVAPVETEEAADETVEIGADASGEDVAVEAEAAPVEREESADDSV
ncbi:MAG: hypothetical protein LBL45_03260 [Treponema sp.]|nr:hypothetical protein [Treponema sp.]